MTLAILTPITIVVTPPPWLPFRSVGQHIYLEATANDAPVWLLLDTGATASFLDTAATRRAHPSGDPSKLEPIRLRIAGRPYGRHRFAPFPLGFSEFDGQTVDGLLGYDFLQNFAVEIDYLGRRLRFHPKATYTMPAGFVSIPLHLLEDDSGGKLPLATIRVTTADGDTASGDFIIDTGARGVAVLATPFGKTKAWFDPAAPRWTPLVGSGSLVKNLRLPVGRVRDLQIGPFILIAPVIGVAQDTTGILSATEFSGIVAGELLSRFRVVFDYGQSRLGLAPNRTYGLRFDFDHCGCTLVADHQSVRVADVLPASPAAEAGLAVGDRLARADGAVVRPSQLDAVRATFRTKTTRRLTIRRGAQLLAITLRLRPLI